MQIDYSKFQQSLSHLIRQYENWSHPEANWSELVREAVAESVIQRFEVCYDRLWKVLKRHMIHALGVTDMPNSPKPVFRIAAENGLLPGDIRNWMKYADLRTDTSHDYSKVKAGQCLLEIPAFIGDALSLYEKISPHPWA